MGGFGVEIVPGAVEVYRQEIDGIEFVLLPVCLGLDKEHLLGQPVGRVGFFWIAAPQIFFLKRDRGELGIGAHGADGDEFFNSNLPPYLHELNAHHEVIVEELSGIFAIRPDTTDPGSKVDDNVGFCIFIEPFYRLHLDEVVILTSRHEDILTDPLPELFNDEGAEEARTASN